MGITKWNWLGSLSITGELIVPFKFRFLCILPMKINLFASMWQAVVSLQSLRATKKRLIHEVKHAIQTINNVIIHTPDTDVLLIALAASTELRSDLFIQTCTKAKSRLISTNKTKSSLGPLYDLDDINMTVKAILGLHAFTGCDAVCAFCGKGKIKPLKILLKNHEYVMTFSGIGLTTDLREEQLDALQEFVCDIYGQTNKRTRFWVALF